MVKATVSTEEKLRTLVEKMIRAEGGDRRRAAPKLALALLEDSRRSLLVEAITQYLLRLPADEGAGSTFAKTVMADIFRRRIPGAGSLD